MGAWSVQHRWGIMQEERSIGRCSGSSDGWELYSEMVGSTDHGPAPLGEMFPHHPPYYDDTTSGEIRGNARSKRSTSHQYTEQSTTSHHITTTFQPTYSPHPTTTMLPNAHLLAKAFHRPRTLTLTRHLSASPPRSRTHKDGTTKGIGSTSKDHTTREAKYNPEADATKAGMEARERSQLLDDATSERDTHRSKEKGEKMYPEAPRPVIGLNDERAPVSMSGGEGGGGMRADKGRGGR